MNARIFRHPTGLELIVARPNAENLQAAKELCPWFGECEKGEQTNLPLGVHFQLRDEGVVLRQWT